MSTETANASRRDFLKASSALAAGAAFVGTMAVPRAVHAGVSEKMRIGLIGCGNRGTSAAENALNASPHNVLVGMADTFGDFATAKLEALKRIDEVKDRVQVPKENIFVGFDAYKQLIDSDVDVVILATPPHFRPLHLAYAVEKGKHTFVEKPVAVDAPGIRSVIETCKKAKAKNLAVVSGLVWRYHPGVQETVKRIVEDKQIGDIVAIQSTYNAGTLWHRGDDPKWSRMEYQIRNWLYFSWLSGDHICEQAIHSLDKTAWVQGDAHPIRAFGLGGRQQRVQPEYGNIYDHHTVFYEWPNDVRVFFTCRQQSDTAPLVDEVVLGTKGQAHLLKYHIDGEKKWQYGGKYKALMKAFDFEHEALINSIRDGKPINNGHYMANSSMLAIMGRMCTYTGQELSWDQCLQSKEQLGPKEYAWNDGVPDTTIAVPGRTKFA